MFSSLYLIIGSQCAQNARFLHYFVDSMRTKSLNGDEHVLVRLCLVYMGRITICLDKRKIDHSYSDRVVCVCV